MATSGSASQQHASASLAWKGSGGVDRGRAPVKHEEEERDAEALGATEDEEDEEEGEEEEDEGGEDEDEDEDEDEEGGDNGQHGAAAAGRHHEGTDARRMAAARVLSRSAAGLRPAVRRRRPENVRRRHEELVRWYIYTRP
jgi:cobalamin biosynthesis protein CobT